MNHTGEPKHLHLATKVACVSYQILSEMSMSCVPTTVSCPYTTHDTNTHICFSENVTSDDLQRTFPLDWSVGYYPKMCRTLCMKQRCSCVDALKVMHNIRERERERERDLLGYGGEDAEPGTELLDGSSGFEPAVPLLLLCLEELITEVLPLLWGERAQDPVRKKKRGEWSKERKERQWTCWCALSFCGSEDYN